MKYFLDVVPRHVLDFYLVVVCTHSDSGGFPMERRWRWVWARNFSRSDWWTPDHVSQRIKSKRDCRMGREKNRASKKVIHKGHKGLQQ